jgi:predicted glycosyltransferase
MRTPEGGLLIYCQSAFGVGHFVRTVRLIRALQGACPLLPIALFYGGRSAAFLNLQIRVKSVELEPLTFGSLSGSLSGPDGSPPGPILRRRRTCLVENLVQLRPRAVLFEHFPFGRWAFREEILPFMESCLSLRPRPLLWSSVREIPVVSEDAYYRMMEVVQCFDRIFVHSDPNVQALDLGLPMPGAVASRLEYTGYVTPNDETQLPRGRHVVVHAGGGRDGQPFWKAVHSLRFSMEPTPFICCGVNPDDLTDYRSMAQQLRSAWRSISMAGYNTVAEWLAFCTPTIFVPRQSDSEQMTRVRTLQKRVGGPMMISDATATALRHAWDGLRDDEPFRAPVWTKGQAHFSNFVRRYFQ